MPETVQYKIKHSPQYQLRRIVFLSSLFGSVSGVWVYVILWIIRSLNGDIEYVILEPIVMGLIMMPFIYIIGILVTIFYGLPLMFILQFFRLDYYVVYAFFGFLPFVNGLNFQKMDVVDFDVGVAMCVSGIVTSLFVKKFSMPV